MRDRILSIISFITVFVPLTIFFIWRPADPDTTGIVIVYYNLIALSFGYTLFLFAKKQLRDIYTIISLGLNGLYFAAIFILAVIPRLN